MIIIGVGDAEMGIQATLLVRNMRHSVRFELTDDDLKQFSAVETNVWKIVQNQSLYIISGLSSAGYSGQKLIKQSKVPIVRV